MEVIRIESDGKGFFQAKIEGQSAGKMTYVMPIEQRMIIDHTEVYAEFNGKGVGKVLVNAAVDYARETGIKITPLCPFAKAVFDKTPAFADVLYV